MSVAKVAGADDERDRDARRELETQSDLSGVRVLAVDDEADARNLVSRILTDCGAMVESASSAAEALEALQKSKPTC